MICPHCHASIVAPPDTNRCPECSGRLDEPSTRDDWQAIARTIEVAPPVDAGGVPAERPLDDKYAPTLALAPSDSNYPPVESGAPAGSEPLGDTLRLASDTASPTAEASQEPLDPAVIRTQAVSPFPHAASTDSPSDETTDFQLGSHHTEMIGLPTDFTPGMSLKVVPVNLAGPEKLALRRFVVQPRGAKSAETIDYTLLAGPYMGGMGKVYRAQQGSLRRDVAIKQIRDDMRSLADERGKFVSEAIITGELEHPNIIPIHELGLVKKDGAEARQDSDKDVDFFYTMKFADGDDWKDVLPKPKGVADDGKPKLSQAENIDVLIKVCDAISYAHSRDIIHRDLKPANIRLGKFGEVWVMDWGLAARLTSPEGFPPAGTPMYMAPEMAIEFLQFSRNQIVRQLATGGSSSQAAQSPVGKHSDVYLLGALLFQIVTRRAPHTGRTGKECLLNAAKNELVPTDVKGELLDIALKALATDPADRYATVAEFKEALRNYQKHVESISLADQADADARAAEDLSIDGKLHAKEVYDLFSSARYGFRNALKIWEQNTRARERLAETELQFAETAYANDDYDLALSLLDPDNPEQLPLYERVLQSAHERQERDRKLKRLRQTLFAVVTLAFVVTSVLLAFWKNEYDENVRLYGTNEQLKETKAVLELDVTALRTTVKSADEAKQIAERAKDDAEKAARTSRQQAADAAQEATLADQRATAADVISKRSAYRAAFQSALAGLLDSGPKKSWDLLRTIPPPPDGEIDWEWHRLVRLAKWERSAERIGSGSPPVHLISCTADGRRLVTGANIGGNAVLQVWDVLDGNLQLLRTYANVNAEVNAVAISGDGRWVAAGLRSAGIGVAIWDVQSGSNDPMRGSGNRTFNAVAFRPNAAPALLAGDSAGNVGLWIPKNGELEASRSFNGQVWGAVQSVAFSKDGKYIATAGVGERINVYPLNNSDHKGWRIQLELGVSAPAVAAIAFHPLDSSKIVCGCNDGFFYQCMWSPNDEEQRRLGDWSGARPIPLQRHSAAIRDLAFTDDGTTLVTCGDDQLVTFWDIEQDGEVMSARQRVSRRIHDAPVASCAISGDGRFAFSADTGGVAYRWDLATVDDFVTVPPARGGDGIPIRPIRSATISPSSGPDRPRVVVGDGAGFARVVESSQSKASYELYVGHRDHSRMIARFIARPQPRIITRTPDGTICSWNLHTGALEANVQLFDQPGIEGANVFTSSPDGRYVVGVANKNAEGGVLSAAIWDTANYQRHPLQITNHLITSLALARQVSGTQPQLLVGQRFGQLLLWDGTWRELVTPLAQPHRGTLSAIAVDGEKYAYVADLGLTVDADKTISKWSLRDSKPTFTNSAYQLPSAGNVAEIRLRLSQDGRMLGVAQADDIGRIVGLQVLNTRELQPVVAAENDYAVRSANLLDVAISADGQVMLGIAGGNELKAWNSQTRAWQLHPTAKRLQAIMSELHRRMAANDLKRVEFIDDARLLAFGDGVALVWDLNSGRVLHRIQSRAPIEAAAIVPGQHDQVATISTDGRYCRWQRPAASSNYEIIDQQFLTQLGYVRAAASPDGTQALVAITEPGENSALAFVDLATGARSAVTALAGEAHAMTWARNGQRVAVAYSGANETRVAVIDCGTRQPIVDIVLETSKPAACLALDDDGKRIAIGGENSVHFAAEPDWNAGQPSHPLGHEVSAIAFSKGGRRLVVGSKSGEIMLWALETSGDSGLRAVMPLAGHDAEITQLRFSKFGQSKVDVLLSGDIHGKTLVHLTSEEQPPLSHRQTD
jgi:WD40 repeat protein/serine/threonine protein kinase